MRKNGLKCIAARTSWSVLLALILASSAWVRTGAAAPFGSDPAVRAAGATGSVPAAQATSQPPAKATAERKVATKKATGRPGSGGPPLPATARTPQIVGRRDPFKLPPPPVPGRAGDVEIIGPLPTGKRGLLIGQLRLEGIVRLDTTNAMIAVVDNNSNRAYFLRENDVVYNGIVSKITPYSVIFKENALDQNGRLVVREVVKRLSPGPGEGR